MSQPLRRTDTFSSAGNGDPFLTKAHTQVGIFVRLEGTGPTVDLQIEGSDAGNEWAPIDRVAPDVANVFNITEADLTKVSSGPDVYVGSFSSHHIMIEMLRVAVTSMTADSLDTTVYLNGKGGRGVQYGRDASISP